MDISSVMSGCRGSSEVRTDVMRLEAVEALAQATLGAYGHVDLVCNNAGVEGYLDGPLWEATSSDWDWTFGLGHGPGAG